MEQWNIVDVDDSRVLEVTYTARKAQKAQKRWYAAYLWSGGPRTTIRRLRVSE